MRLKRVTMTTGINPRDGRMVPSRSRRCVGTEETGRIPALFLWADDLSFRLITSAINARPAGLSEIKSESVKQPATLWLWTSFRRYDNSCVSCDGNESGLRKTSSPIDEQIPVYPKGSGWFFIRTEAAELKHLISHQISRSFTRTQQFAFILAAKCQIFLFSWVTGFYNIRVIFPSLKVIHTCLRLSIPRGSTIRKHVSAFNAVRSLIWQNWGYKEEKKKKHIHPQSVLISEWKQMERNGEKWMKSSRRTLTFFFPVPMLLQCCMMRLWMTALTTTCEIVLHCFGHGFQSRRSEKLTELGDL